MPLYGSATPITQTPGKPSEVWSNETLTLPAQSKSQAIYLKRQANMPNCISIEVQFGGSPGAFQIDVEAADTDAEAFYIKVGTGLSTLGSGNVARLEIPSIVAKFVRLKMTTRTNAVAVTAKIF
jgi:hypothetical protein